MEKFVDLLFEVHHQKLTKTKIRSAIDQGFAFLNGKMHRIATTVCSSKDRVELRIPEENSAPKKPEKIVAVYEDPFIVIWDKPVGVLSDPKRFKGLVHRLDKETAGLLIQAKTLEAKAAFEALFKERKISKRYLAIVHGNYLKPVLIDLPIARLGRVAGFERFGVSKLGAKASTNTKPLFFGKNATLLECAPITGRTHQIRVHLSAVGFPIVGDLLYGKKEVRFPRMLLHSTSLEFIHPFTGEKIFVESPAPREFDQFFSHPKTP